MIVVRSRPNNRWGGAVYPRGKTLGYPGVAWQILLVFVRRNDRRRSGGPSQEIKKTFENKIYKRGSQHASGPKAHQPSMSLNATIDNGVTMVCIFFTEVLLPRKANVELSTRQLLSNGWM